MSNNIKLSRYSDRIHLPTSHPKISSFIIGCQGSNIKRYCNMAPEEVKLYIKVVGICVHITACDTSLGRDTVHAVKQSMLTDIQAFIDPAIQSTKPTMTLTFPKDYNAEDISKFIGRKGKHLRKMENSINLDHVLNI